MKNKIVKKIFTVIFAFCLMSGVALAAESANISLPSGENVPTDFINAGQNVDVGSDVNGDVILAGSNVSFSGNAAGDIILAGGTVRIKGDSAGDIRAAGGTVTLDGKAAKNVTVVGGTVVLDEDSVVDGNLYIAGGSIELRGEVKGNAVAYGSQIILSGKVGGNADFRSSEVIVRKDASIAGNLTYSSSNDIGIEEGVVKGEVTKIPMENVTNNYVSQKDFDGESNFVLVIWQFFSLLIVALILFRLFGRQIKALTVPINKEEVWNRIAYGFISLVLNPIIIFLSFITLVGLPLAIIILFIYIVFLIVAFVLTPVLLGKLVNAKARLYEEDENALWKNFIFGYILMQIIGFIPFLGGLAIFILFLFSFGRVTKYVTTALKENK